MATEIWLVRHGETEWSKTGQHTGREDLPLTEKGEQEARELSRVLNGRRFEAVMVSPLQRARKTCEIAGYSANAEVVPDLMEWDYGDVSGKTRHQMQEAVPGWTVWKGPLANGETVEDVAVRARRVLGRLECVEGEAILFAHGHLLRILTSVYLGFAPVAAQHFALSTGRVSVLGFDYGNAAMLRWNAR